ncbi:hypothetical protein Poly51_62100 [Rubripirellula tenax]|uniref:Uncharacterized protein n=1 Tax=Rubripirellula tenax TaxID=2528015 RepID=A0A5C6E460_9BACT|nr:hypothetical protein Poly51_62100 [Rubripirellula tenax]
MHRSRACELSRMDNQLSRPGDGHRYPNWCAVIPHQRRTLGIQTLATTGRSVDRFGRVVFRNVEHVATIAGRSGSHILGSASWFASLPRASDSTSNTVLCRDRLVWHLSRICDFPPCLLIPCLHHRYELATMVSPKWTESRLAASRRCFLLAQIIVATSRRYFPLARPMPVGGSPRNT